MHERYLQALTVVWQQSLGPDMPLEPTQYLETIVQDVANVKPDTLRCIHLPLLKHILPDAVGRLEDPVCRELHSVLRGVYSTVLLTYTQTYVQKQPAGGETLSRKTVNCKCKDYWSLNLFLANAVQQTVRYEMVKKRREHLEHTLNASRFDGTNVMERNQRTNREPHMLVVTKRDRQAEAYDAWLKRCRIAYDELEKFNTASLRKVIPLAYDWIVTMRTLITNDARRPDFLPVTLRPIRATELEAPGRRPDAPTNAASDMEVIDLCGDSD